ncbi:hypothetical protein [Caballeronia sp. LZ001]|uniref:hypothetical protein n=1 Tax=Caballeronia sp. LZ001 TaxID=3038553 RepID=UPI00285D4B27|nr:hypothetical protein [Caballeronia sp. LZ001]MDR5799785.1 hypothetical protein [Caballeronia sp. LZ001]
MSEQNERQTPPKQTNEDPNVADRRLSDEQKSELKNEPEPAKGSEGGKLPDPKDVGEAG